jgi:hypothetical protein
MVVWLFAGGGESEVRGLVPFLEKNFACLRFERKTPIRQKPGPKPPKNRAESAYGKSGKSLQLQIKRQLKIALLHGKCDLILVVDDLDCHDFDTQEKRFLQTILSVPGTASIKKIVAFAAPERKAWLIADWNNTIAKDVDFRKEHQAMRWWLSRQANVPFDAPESFSVYDPSKDACKDKLSDAIIESANLKAKARYSKAIHTPRLIQTIDPTIVSQKCPLFRQLYRYLSEFCR